MSFINICTLAVTIKVVSYSEYIQGKNTAFSVLQWFIGDLNILVNVFEVLRGILF